MVGRVLKRGGIEVVRLVNKIYIDGNRGRERSIKRWEVIASGGKGI